MVHVVLVHPEIAPNTGNIIRLCANTGVSLHLIEPLGFSLDDRLLRRAGLDYHELTTVRTHDSLTEAATLLTQRWFGFSSNAEQSYAEVTYQPDDVLVFGAERNGLSTEAADLIDPQRMLSLPMVPDSRSLNLANAVAVVVYEAWRQRGFADAAEQPAQRAGSGLSAETPGGPAFDL